MFNMLYARNSLVVQWLGLRASTAGGMDSIPGWGTKILHTVQHGKKKKKKKRKKEKLLHIYNGILPSNEKE